jgi:hypothetical protein
MEYDDSEHVLHSAERYIEENHRSYRSAMLQVRVARTLTVILLLAILVGLVADSGVLVIRLVAFGVAYLILEFISAFNALKYRPGRGPRWG